MTAPKKRPAARPARQEQIQPRPAEPVRDRVLDPGNRDGEFLPNPTERAREGRPRPYVRYLRVTGPHEVHGVAAPGWLEVELSDMELHALVQGGHVVDYPAGAGWGEDDAPDSETEADAPLASADAPKDEPKAGAEKEGN